MDSSELGQVLDAIGWQPQELQRRLSVRGDTVRQWLNGRRPVPGNVAEWLYRVRDGIDTAGLPDGWER